MLLDSSIRLGLDAADSIPSFIVIHTRCCLVFPLTVSFIGHGQMQVVVFTGLFVHSLWVNCPVDDLLCTGSTATDCVGRDEIRIAHDQNAR